MRADEELLKAATDRQDEWLEVVSELVRRPSPNPPGDTRAAAAFVVEYLTKRGHRPDVITGQATMPNVLASIDNGAGPHLILNGHLDIMQLVRQAVTRVTGEAPFFNISGPGTDSRVFRRVGIPVAVFGPTPYGMGAADEYVTVADYLDTVRVHALSALAFLGRDP